MKIQVDLERMTLDDLIALEDKSIKAIRDVMARFVVGEDGQYMSHAEAKKAIGALNLVKFKEVSEQFAEAVKGAQTNALPPTGSGKS